ncbi:hypothetical protein CEXT_154601 [Caerostris extrusa]|uniref:Uncharacterized protein n=1 Tax=Caerostris extrusa TaxID=172846 RepID=A0AAV4M622_CAEEX|nr:hypothetical protein CEXT_154601 [Caerostris extrusa]
MRSPRLFYPMQLNKPTSKPLPIIELLFVQKFLRARGTLQKHLLPPSGSGSRSSEESLGTDSDATESATESYVHLEHRTILTRCFSRLEATDILASQYDEEL